MISPTRRGRKCTGLCRQLAGAPENRAGRQPYLAPGPSNHGVTNMLGPAPRRETGPGTGPELLSLHTLEDTEATGGARVPCSIDLSRAVNNTWIVTFEGQTWPAILCDANSIPMGMFQSKPKPDCLPVFIFGHRKYVWVTLAELRHWDPVQNYQIEPPEWDVNNPLRLFDDERAHTRSARYTAFTRDARMLMPARSWFNFWKEQHELDIEAAATQIGPSIDFVQTATEIEEARNARRCRLARSEKRRADVPAQSTNPINDSFIYSMDDPPSSIFGIVRADNSVWTQPNFEGLPSDRHYDVYLSGNSEQQHRISRDVFDKCDILADLVQYTEKRGYFVDLSKAPGIEIQEKYLVDIMDFLQDGDFVPFKPLHGSEELTIPGGQPGFEQAAIHIAFVYKNAAELRLHDLQELCCWKISVMQSRVTSQVILQVGNILDSAKKWGTLIDELTLDWRTGHIAGDFYNMMEICGLELATTMRYDHNLRRAVLTRLALEPDRVL